MLGAHYLIDGVKTVDMEAHEHVAPWKAQASCLGQRGVSWPSPGWVRAQ